MSHSWMRLKSIALHDANDPAAKLYPRGASEEYRRAREELMRAEMALRDEVERVAQLRRALPEGAVMADYRFVEGPPSLSGDEPLGEVALCELFGRHDSLVVYHLMFHPDDNEACPMCSLWVDGLYGVSHHLRRRTAFVVIGKAPIKKLRAWARRRGWEGLRILSSYETTFNADLEVERPSGGQVPGVSVFSRSGEEVRHVITETASFADGSDRGIDLLSPVWNVFDLLANGRGDWYPDNEYPTSTRGELSSTR